MAVTSIWPVKTRLDRVIKYVRNPEKTTEKSCQEMAEFHSIENVLEYAVNDMKTEERKYVSCIGFSREEVALEKFRNIQKLYGKTDGRVCYHGYQSFRENEVTAEQAHEIGVKLAERLWGDRYYVVVATHLNTGHYHNHFVINSVSHIDGIKFHNTKEDYRLMRQESDRLCKEYEISVIEQTNGISKSYSEWRAEKAGQLTQRDIIRRDIDVAVKASVTNEQFMKIMEEMGYEFKTHTSDGEPLKYPAIKPPDAKGYYRLHKLGDSYSLQSISNRIHNNYVREYPVISRYENKIYRSGRLYNSFKKVKHRGIYALYIRYCFELGIIKKNQPSVKRVSFSLREDVICMDKYMEQSKVLGKYKIETIEQLSTAKFFCENTISKLTAERKDLRNQLKKVGKIGDEQKENLIRSEISNKSDQLKIFRKDMNALIEVERCSCKVKENLVKIEKQKIIEKQEVERYEHKFGCSRTTREDVVKYC